MQQRPGMQMLWVLLLLAAENTGMEARYAAQAAMLFQDGQERLQAGKYGTARLAFQALVSVYPESPLAEPARSAMRKAEELEQKQARTTLVRSIRFSRLSNVTPAEVIQRFEEREVGLSVERQCLKRQVEEARLVLREFLTERGAEKPRVKVNMRRDAAGKVDITFRVE